MRQLLQPSNLHLPEAHLLHGKSVAIIGGGPAGLTLARLLQLARVDVRVYERDVGPEARTQGGSLDLHEGSGQLALKRCGLERQFDSLSRPEGQAAMVYDRSSVLRASLTAADDGGSKPEIDRLKLRGLLLSALEEGTVIWDRRLDEITPLDGNRYRLAFSSGDTLTADVVIGCDGIRSKARETLSPVAPVYTGVTFIETRLADVDMRHPEIARLVGTGSVMGLGQHRGLLAQRNGDGSIRVYVARRLSEHWLHDNGLDPRDPASTRRELLSWFSGWAPKLTELLSHSDDQFLPWPLYVLRMSDPWTTREGLTMIGDAAHIMPPFLGAGANMAMLDAVELSDTLTSTRSTDLTVALATFERHMLDRMTPLIEQSIAIQNVMFADDAPDGLVALVKAGKKGS
jgi:2-polyprenyl-6-methoxyphenol hydroxylase-like FAD-dependent oxidoreductase